MGPANGLNCSISARIELAALVVALHRASQESLPIVFFGAGLPQLAALTGDAKSYAERLFDFTTIGPLDRQAAIKAIRQPIKDEGESISDSALNQILCMTHGYPYFLQEWGRHTWNAAKSSPISRGDVTDASNTALQSLDQGFFSVRYNRLTPAEKEYVIAMTKCGQSPYRSADVAKLLGKTMSSLGPRRESLITKGVIYSPAHGDIAFTVPMFEKFVGAG